MFPGVSQAQGSLQVAGIPTGATIKAAYLYTSDWFSTAPLQATFGSQSLGSSDPASTDGQFSNYRWDVTSAITGNGSYDFDLTGGTQIYSVALAIVYSEPGMPDRVVTLTDFSHEVGAPADHAVAGADPNPSVSLEAMYGGLGTLWLLTNADDSASTGEGIYFNTNQVGGPVDSNLGLYGSLFRLPVNVQAGTNVVSMTSNGDWYGWSLAILDAPSSVVPEPASILLTMTGLGALLLCRRRRS